MNAPLRLPHTQPPGRLKPRPGRFAATIRTDSPRGCAIALLGLPDDTGVKLNHGQAGAAKGPNAFREALASFGTAWDGLRCRPLNVQVFDAGDIQPVRGGTEAALMETHARIERAVHEIHQLGLMPVCVGGGHDLTLPSINALARHAGKRVGGISLDAHLDVRPEAGSGMAFRHLIETKRLDPRRFAVVGVGRFVNEPDHLQWLTNQGARLVFADSVLVSGLPLKRLMADLAKANSAFVSIDLDVIDSASAPGVSALNPLGLSAPDAASLAEAAGAAPHVRHFDLMELNPAQDASGRTARLAALLFLSFLTGFGRRRA